MKRMKLWGICLPFYFLIGVSLYGDIAQLEAKKGEVFLDFPLPFQENEKLFSRLLCSILLAELPPSLQESLTFEVKGQSLHFFCQKKALAFVRQRIGQIIQEGVEEAAFFRAKMCHPEIKWVELDALNQWIATVNPILFLDKGWLKGDHAKRVSQRTLSGREETRHFYGLRLSFDDCDNISKLIKNMADLNLWDLLKKVKEMKKLGRNLQPVHPLRFLGYIFSKEELKNRMPKIKDNYFKWSEFTDGLFERLSKEADHHNLSRFIPGFVQMIGCSEVVIEQCIIDRDWLGMLDYLMD